MESTVMMRGSSESMTACLMLIVEILFLQMLHLKKEVI